MYDRGYQDGRAGRDPEFTADSDYMAGHNVGTLDRAEATPGMITTSFSVNVPGNTKRIEIFIDMEGKKEENDRAARKKADLYLQQGRRIDWHDGSSEWINVEADFDLDRNDYTWHEDGNRVRCSRVHRIKAADGSMTYKILRKSWRLYDNVT